jgi:hypothetical protein
VRRHRHGVRRPGDRRRERCGEPAPGERTDHRAWSAHRAPGAGGSEPHPVPRPWEDPEPDRRYHRAARGRDAAAEPPAVRGSASGLRQRLPGAAGRAV